MKQTAVEWLVEQFEKIVFYSEEAKENTIKQAKEMEKQQQDEFAIEFIEWLCDEEFTKEEIKTRLEIFKNK